MTFESDWFDRIAPSRQETAKLNKHAKRRILSDIDTNPQQTWDDLGTKEDVSDRTVTGYHSTEAATESEA